MKIITIITILFACTYVSGQVLYKPKGNQYLEYENQRLIQEHVLQQQKREQQQQEYTRQLEYARQQEATRRQQQYIKSQEDAMDMLNQQLTIDDPYTWGQ